MATHLLLTERTVSALREADNYKAARMEGYLESWDQLEERNDVRVMTHWKMLTPSNCFEPRVSSDEARLVGYLESLDMLEEFESSTYERDLEAMGVFVHGILLREFAKLERYRETLNVA